MRYSKGPKEGGDSERGYPAWPAQRRKIEGHVGGHDGMRNNNNWLAALISFVIHLSIILILAALVIPSLPMGNNVMSLIASAVSNEQLESIPEIDLSQSNDQMEVMEESLEAVTLSEATFETEMEIPSDLLTAEVEMEDSSSDVEALMEAVNIEGTILASDTRKSTKKRKSLNRLMPTLSKKGTAVKEPLMTEPKEGVKQADTTSEAADGVLSKLAGASGHDGPIWIIWLMDSSLSLLKERQALAPQVHEFYEKLALNDKETERVLNSAVFAFGSEVIPVNVDRGDPTPKAISRAIDKLPIDPSGLENVMSAIAYAIASVPNMTKDTRIEVVVWTDESGDDLAMLEDVIQLCRFRNAHVHVVGPLSVLGMEGGLQQYTIPAPYNYDVLLPVKRGPDSAFPERAQLPLWFDSRNVTWDEGRLIPAAGGGNLGGPHRKRLLAPTGPYALTRLALATGGTFTALKRAGDLAPNNRERFVDYLPDYRSGIEIASDIDSYPLRRAIIEAAAITGTVEYWPPRFEFPTLISDQFPYTRGVPYLTAEAFQTVLDDQLATHVRKLVPTQVMIEAAIATMLLQEPMASSGSYSGSLSGAGQTTPKKSRITLEIPAEYEIEESPRWRAWYALNLGRLLAHSIRITEYRFEAERILLPEARVEQLKKGINYLNFSAAENLAVASETQMRAALARKLLQQVIDEHPSSPWSELARWEIEHPFGFTHVERKLPPPVMVPIPPVRLMPAPPIPKL